MPLNYQVVGQAIVLPRGASFKARYQGWCRATLRDELHVLCSAW